MSSLAERCPAYPLPKLRRVCGYLLPTLLESFPRVPAAERPVPFAARSAETAFGAAAERPAEPESATTRDVCSAAAAERGEFLPTNDSPVPVRPDDLRGCVTGAATGLISPTPVDADATKVAFWELVGMAGVDTVVAAGWTAASSV